MELNSKPPPNIPIRKATRAANSDPFHERPARTAPRLSPGRPTGRAVGKRARRRRDPGGDDDCCDGECVDCNRRCCCKCVGIALATVQIVVLGLYMFALPSSTLPDVYARPSTLNWRLCDMPGCIVDRDLCENATTKAVSNCCSDHLFDMLRFSDALLTRYNVTYFAIFGTLLGAVRNGDIIPWTADIDLAVDHSAFAERVAGSPEALAWARDAGYLVFHDDIFRICRLRTWGLLDVFRPLRQRYGEPYADIYAFGTEHGAAYVEVCQYATNVILPLSTGLVRGYEIPMPADPAAVVRLDYGQFALQSPPKKGNLHGDGWPCKKRRRKGKRVIGS